MFKRCETCEQFGRENCAKHWNTTGAKVDRAIDRALGDDTNKSSGCALVLIGASSALTLAATGVKAYAKSRGL